MAREDDYSDFSAAAAAAVKMLLQACFVDSEMTHSPRLLMNLLLQVSDRPL